MHWLLERIGTFGERPALATAERVWSYAELAALAEAEVRRLSFAGVGAGEVVAIPGDHDAPTVARLLACLARACIAVPMTALTPEETATRLRIAGATRLMDDAGVFPTGVAAVDSPHYARLRESGHAGLVLFSSGTSGEPKAMVQDLAALVDAHRDRRAKALSIVLFLLFDHIGGLNTLLNGLASGALLVVPGSRQPDAVCAMIARHRAVVLPASPTFLNLLSLSGAASRHDLSSLRIITYGTEPMPESLLARLRAQFRGVKFIQTFGTSETGIARTLSKSSESTLLKFDDPDQEWKVVEGELWLRSKTQVLGYLNAPAERFTADGWFRTGDRVELADEGYLRITGRLTELINVGGEKVMPAEVESVILEVPGVADVLVAGEANPITGRIVVARVVAAGEPEPDALKRAIRARCREKLAAYKVPAKVVFVPAIDSGARQKKVRRGES